MPNSASTALHVVSVISCSALIASMRFVWENLSDRIVQYLGVSPLINTEHPGQHEVFFRTIAASINAASPARAKPLAKAKNVLNAMTREGERVSHEAVCSVMVTTTASQIGDERGFYAARFFLTQPRSVSVLCWVMLGLSVEMCAASAMLQWRDSSGAEMMGIATLLVFGVVLPGFAWLPLSLAYGNRQSRLESLSGGKYKKPTLTAGS